VGDVNDEAGDVVDAVGQGQDPEGTAGAHTDREGGDVFEGAGEPHFPGIGRSEGSTWTVGT
jgi:hypothetical protein